MTCLANQFVLGQVIVVSADSCASLNSTLSSTWILNVLQAYLSVDAQVSDATNAAV